MVTRARTRNRWPVPHSGLKRLTRFGPGRSAGWEAAAQAARPSGAMSWRDEPPDVRPADPGRRRPERAGI